MRCEILENGQQEHGRYDFPVFFQLISFIINLFQPLDHRQKSQLLCFQANPASFAKTPGVGGYPPVCKTHWNLMGTWEVPYNA